MIRSQRWEEALEQLIIVRQRLSAIEIDARIGLAYYKLGDRERAREAWAAYLHSRPIISPELPLEEQAEIFQEIAKR